MIRVIMGLSGGIDSSISSFFLKKKGYNIICLFMKNWESNLNLDSCEKEIYLKYSLSICYNLGIKLILVNFSSEYWKYIFIKSVKSFYSCYNFNMDILCNRYIKFLALINYSMNVKNYFISSGHYCNKTKLNNLYNLSICYDKNKDQSYFLYNIKGICLDKLIFPLCNMQKINVRSLSKKKCLYKLYQKG